MDKSPDAFRTITEVAEWLDTPAHVLRFWESRFSQIKPVKRAGGRRYYRPTDMLLLGGIKKLLHDDGITIKAVQALLRDESVRHVQSLSLPVSVQVTIKKKSRKTAVNAKIEQKFTPPSPPEKGDSIAERTEIPDTLSDDNAVASELVAAITTTRIDMRGTDVEDISEKTATTNPNDIISKLIKLPSTLKISTEISHKDIQDIEALYYSLKMVRNNMKRTGVAQ